MQVRRITHARRTLDIAAAIATVATTTDFLVGKCSCNNSGACHARRSRALATLQRCQPRSQTLAPPAPHAALNSTASTAKASSSRRIQQQQLHCRRYAATRAARMTVSTSHASLTGTVKLELQLAPSILAHWQARHAAAPPLHMRAARSSYRRRCCKHSTTADAVTDRAAPRSCSRQQHRLHFRLCSDAQSRDTGT
jgi:hypothetical protein